ncbi:MAG: hypothetical protein ABIO38_03925 [Luteimonas sp.]
MNPDLALKVFGFLDWDAAVRAPRAGVLSRHSCLSANDVPKVTLSNRFIHGDQKKSATKDRLLP